MISCPRQPQRAQPHTGTCTQYRRQPHSQYTRIDFCGVGKIAELHEIGSYIHPGSHA